MDEVAKTHLPLLAWRWHENRYQLVYDDVPVGELTIDQRGRGVARYHENHWILEPAGPRVYDLRDQKTEKVLGLLRVESAGEPEEGHVEIEGKSFRFLRDARKLPPRVTITGDQGQPLLQFREEDEDHGKIQVDSLPAASTPEFERLVLWGLHLYLTASPNLHITLTSRKPERRHPPRGTRKQRGRTETLTRSTGPRTLREHDEENATLGAARWVRWTCAGAFVVIILGTRGWKRWLALAAGATLAAKTRTA